MSKHTLFPIGTALLISAAQLPSLATTTSTYDIESPGLLAQADNLLRQEGTQKSFTSTATTGFYETNAASTDCLFDGAIPYASSAYAEQESRYLIRKGDTFVWTFDGTKTLDDIRFWTQWSDGYRTDISVASVAVTYDGETWETLPDSSFSASKTESENTVAPYLGSENANLHYRRVRFGNEGEEPIPLAVGILGLKVVFGTQELEYTSHWELEAKGSEYFAGETPIVRVTRKSGAVSSDGGSATETISVNLPFLGTAADARATLSVRWGTAADALTETTTMNGTYATGPADVILTGLTPRQTYYAQVVAIVGEEEGVSDVVSFIARAEPITLIAQEAGDHGYVALADTQLALATNLPGGNWVCGGGWEWARPQTAGDSLYTAEEMACFALPLASNGTYVKPERITVSARISHSQGRGGIGFWSSVVPQSGYYPVEGGEEGETEIRRYNARENFTGLIFNPYSKTLQTYYDGSLRGPAVPVETTGDKDYHQLTYTIDTTTGELVWVMLNNKPVLGLVSTAFTDANTAYVGLISYDGGRTRCQDFEVSEGKDMPSIPVFEISALSLPVTPGAVVSVLATAVNSVTGDPMELRMTADGCTGATYVDGVFSWTAGDPGTYHVTFTAGVGADVESRVVEIRVYAQPPAAPEGMKAIYATSGETASSEVKFAGTVQAEAEDRTSWGLSVNRPNAAWIWNSGYDWAKPHVVGGRSEFDLNNELSSVMLPLLDTESYKKPEQIFVEASFTFTGRGVIGFWKGLPQDEYSTAVTRGFTGLYFEKNPAKMRLYVDGQAVGSEVTALEFFEEQNAIRFVLDRKQKVIRDVVLNGFPVGDFEIPALTDELSDYVGIGSHGNIVGYSGRLNFQSFRVSGSVKGGLIIVVR